MFTPSIDLGQLALGILIAIIGWFVKKELNSLTTRLDRHDNILIRLVSELGELKGLVKRD